MDNNIFLSLTLEEVKIALINNGYIIDEEKFLNEPPGVPRVVRIREISSGRMEILASYHKDLVCPNN